MNTIELLDSSTIDKIAAGEVVERPSSIVKELVENAIDAGAKMITVEIENGGIDLIRVSDDGSGIPKEQVQKAFWRHATSKIRSVEDLSVVRSLGFRGEALSSIAAVSQVELLTKTEEETYGTRYCIEGGKERKLEPTASRTGSSFYIRNLFYNVPARKKFLKTGMTEAGHVQTILTHMAMSHPEVALTFIVNGQEKLHTPGNGELKSVIYGIYGREIASNLIPVDISGKRMKVRGYLGKPVISRSNRKYENYYLNGRYFTSTVVAKAIEDAYHPYMMQHQYPFVVLQIELDPADADVNVHPAKMEVRFNRQQEIYEELSSGLNRVLHDYEMLPQLLTGQEKKSAVPATAPVQSKIAVPATKPAVSTAAPVKKYDTQKVEQTFVVKEPEPEKNYSSREAYFMEEMRKRVLAHHKREQEEKQAEVKLEQQAEKQTGQQTEKQTGQQTGQQEEKAVLRPTPNEEKITAPVTEAVEQKQLDLFEEKILTKERRREFRLVGQIFRTYWIVESKKQLLLIDQHAAHEKVLYEKIYKKLQNESLPVQMISPPIVLHLSMQEQNALTTHMDAFVKNGFEIEHFGGDDYAVRGVPMDLSGLADRERLMEMIDEFTDDLDRKGFTTSVEHRLATISCKAAVKGEQRISAMEMEALLDELLNMENPYHCPHGRPTMITMTQDELEKRFKRIV